MTSPFKLLFLCLIAGLFSQTAAAFPEMIGIGYNSCGACHREQTGGGPLTDYGRGIAEEFLSTWSVPKEGEAFYGGLSLAPLGLHGDFRYLAFHYEDDQVTVNQRFPMQRELSVSLDASKNVSLLISCGYYGFEPASSECRRYFANLQVGPAHLRAGRFLPAFGINIPDHTKSTKELFGQGKESLNVEASLTHRYFEVFFTRILGSESGVSTGTRPTVNVRDDRSGYSFKGSLFVARGVQLGGSLASLEDGEVEKKYASYHAFAGNDRLVLMGEVQSYPDKLRRGYGMLGVRPFKGFWVKTEVNAIEHQDTEVFGTLQWFPRPHFEFLFTGSQKSLIFISHWYL